MKLRYLPAVLILLALGCAVVPKQQVWMEKGATLSHYQVFEVLPAQNETGKTFDTDVAATLTDRLVSGLRAKNYTVNPGAVEVRDILIVRSRLVIYEPASGSSGAKCVVRTALIDKKTGKLLGEMLTSQSIVGAGEALLLGGGLVHIAVSMNEIQKILDRIAASIVDELEKRIKEKEAKPR
jgi:hypothetical protein